MVIFLLRTLCADIFQAPLLDGAKLLDVFGPFLVRHFFFALHLHANLLDDVRIGQRRDIPDVPAVGYCRQDTLH
jgi:hypothetical protein